MREMKFLFDGSKGSLKILMAIREAYNFQWQ
jgi:hypothetical protein